MTTKTKNSVANYFTLENAKDAASLVNTVALSSTEKVFMKGFEVAEKLQATTDKLIKKGLKKSAKHQDFVFDTLEDSKVKALKLVKKATNIFNKK